MDYTKRQDIIRMDSIKTDLLASVAKLKIPEIKHRCKMRYDRQETKRRKSDGVLVITSYYELTYRVPPKPINQLDFLNGETRSAKIKTTNQIWR